MKTVTDAILDKSPDLYVNLVRRWQEEQGTRTRRRGEVVPISRYQDRTCTPPNLEAEEEEAPPASWMTRAMVAFIVAMSAALCVALISLGMP